LHSRFLALGAKMGAFGPWEVPLYFSSILEEHEAVRSRAGVFDISHMGEFFFSGAGALSFLESLLPRPVSKMEIGQALYMPLLNSRGGILDDILLYRTGPSAFLMIVNAGNVENDERWIRGRVASGVTFEDRTEDFGLLALQGPASAGLAGRLFGLEAAALGYYRFLPWKDGMISRTGYTGEDGFEIMLPKSEIPALWDLLFKEGAPDGLCPVGFGARDTLRLEAGMLLHGHDMKSDITPLEAGIGWAVDLNKTEGIGLEALREQKKAGIQRRMAGFEMLERGIPREGYAIFVEGKPAGQVTSGTFSPTLKKNIGLGYVAAGAVEPGRELEIEIRDRRLKACIVPLPFYRRKR